MKKLYCFDFDGTITTKDTMFLFLRFYNPGRYYFQFMRHVPLFLMMKLKLANTEKVKKSFITSILKDEKQKKLEELAQNFFKEYKNSIMRENALDFFKNIDKNATAYLVTASLDIWVKPFAEHFNFGYISTEAKFVNGKFAGDFATRNCNGPEKVTRIKRTIDLTRFDKTIAFGDTSGDKPMLEWADEGYFKFFH
ncbi:HAD superfamily hydrolase (TIGR01490 family) [Elizabethkingia sp. YR214]|uniref:HAD family hydrolase n=1 Tax=Elizabethkingia sp. YR214 TaxID=2135667 RepID=UPI000D2FD468|nr:HAD family hydrolase [Elizabethkingia sp. YR214]PUB30789.1 HAD superfamily hydrolase (TIGR01490 family) [Elizabethkingia sp. YR214]